MSDWDYTFTAYRGKTMIVQVSLSGPTAMEHEWEIGRGLLDKGTYDRIRLTDLRPKWKRELDIEKYTGPQDREAGRTK